MASMTTRLARASIDARESRRLARCRSTRRRARAMSGASASTSSSSDGTRERADVDDAKREAARTTEAHAKSFHLASTFMSARAREEAYALYAWCRECDQLVDAAGEATSRTREEAARALDGVERRLSAIF